MSELITPERILKKIGIAIICAVAAVYVGRQLILLFGEKLETETALAVTVEEAIEAEGYIMRDEIILTSANPGIMLASVHDGERVSKGKEAVTVYYAENDYNTENGIRSIENKIEILEKSSLDTEYVSADMDKMDSEIDGMLSEARVYCSQNDLRGAMNLSDSILVEMNKRWLISNPGKSYRGRINELEKESIALKRRLSGNSASVIATQSGYYYCNTDGYENIFSAAKLKNLTLSRFDEMKESSPESYSGNIAGKIAPDYHWYVACPVTREEAGYFEVGSIYTVEFTYNYGSKFDMELYSKIIETGREDALLVFVSSNVPQNFDFSRCQKLRIVYNEYRGLKVPKEAIRFVDDMKGVHVVNGTVIEFKRAEEIYSFDEFYIIDDNPESEKYSVKYERKKNNPDDKEEKTRYYRSLSLYDVVVVKGRNVYDGMKVE